MTLALPMILLSPPELCVNGRFDADRAWIKEGGWTIANGVAVHSPVGAGSLYQLAPRLVEGHLYRMKLRVTRTAGSLFPFLRGTNSLLVISESGSYSVDVRAGSDTNFQINLYAEAAFEGTVDDVSVQRISA